MNIFFKIKGMYEAEFYKRATYKNPLKLQEKVLAYLIHQAKDTVFGKDHHFSAIKNYQDFKKNVPIRDYHGFEQYFDLILKHQENITWPGLPLYLIISSASTGKPKLLPATQEYLSNFARSAYRVIFQYIYDTRDYSLLDGRFMNFTGTLNLQEHHGYLVGPLSGIVRTVMPKYLAHYYLPSKETLSLMDSAGWDVMFEKAAQEGFSNNVTLCSGLPSWMAQYFNKCMEVFKVDDLKEIMPNMRVLFTSGVNYKPYLPQFNALFSKKLAIREVYGASEGFFAYSDNPYSDDLLLDVSKNYYEFLELSHSSANGLPNRINLADVKINMPYIIIISTCSGLWSYKIGDVIEFTNTNPYRIRVLGRTSQFISIQTEHVYSEHVELALKDVNMALKLDINNFTITPNDADERCIPYHQWYIETLDLDVNLDIFSQMLDEALMIHSAGYAKSRKRNSLAQPKVILLKPGAFIEYLSTKNNSSLQLKVPKVSNERTIAQFLIERDLVL